MNQAHEVEMLTHLKSHLEGKVIILGIGNTLRSDDAVGSLLAQRISEKTRLRVFDAGPTPENYLGKIIREEPDTVVIIDAVDFGVRPGEFRILEKPQIQAANLFTTHNASISLTIDYLQSHTKADIIVLIIQPKRLALGETLSQEVEETLGNLTEWFSQNA